MLEDPKPTSTPPRRHVKGPSPRPVFERFAAKVSIADNGCWLWTGATVRGRYGKFFTHKTPDRRTILVYAHRWAYEHYVGPIPDGLTIDHLCHTPSCVNPTHLEVVTQAENNRRILPERRRREYPPRRPPVHGRNVTYGEGCRCEPCRAAHATYAREWRAARKRAA